MTEQWRDIPGFEGAYQVSDLGRVRSLDRRVRHSEGRHMYFLRGRILHPSLTPKGYFQVNLGRAKKMKVHAPVMLTFIGPYPKGLEIRHLNGIPGDNRLVNLEYGTRSRNALDVKWHGGRTNTRLTPQDVLDIKRRLGPRIGSRMAWGRSATLARKYGVSSCAILDIWHGRSHKDIDLDEFDNKVGI